MRIEQLYYLVEIAQSDSITMASERLHITQPSLSSAISNLEKELGVALLERTRQGARLTEVGESVVKRAKEILYKIDELKIHANIKSSVLTGNLSLAVVRSACMTILPGALAFFKQKHPNVKTSIREKGSYSIIKNVLAGTADIGIITIPDAENYFKYKLFDNEQIQSEYLYHDELMICVGKSSPLSIKDTILLEEIIDHPLIGYNSEYILIDQIIKMLKKCGEPNVILHTDNTEIAKKMIAQGNAIGFFAKKALKEDLYVLKGEIIPLHISDLNLKITCNWIRSNNHHFSAAAKEFVRILKNQH